MVVPVGVVNNASEFFVVAQEFGRLRFVISVELSKRVAVVGRVIDDAICRSPVEALPKNLEGVTGEISENLNFVLAAPIYNADKSIWGVVDFDAGNDVGRAYCRRKFPTESCFSWLIICASSVPYQANGAQVRSNNESDLTGPDRRMGAGCMAIPDLPIFLRQMTWVDLRTDYESNFSRLVAAIQHR